MWEKGNTTDNLEGNLVRDFIPVKDAFGHGALYDRVSGKVFNPVYYGGSPTEHLAVGEETGDEVCTGNNPVVGAAVFYNPSGAGGVGDFHAVLHERMLTITVNPAAVTNDSMALCVCSDIADRGSDVNDWAQVLVITNPVPTIGGVYRVEINRPEVTGRIIRPFLVRVISTEELTYLRTNIGKNQNPYLHTGVPAKSGTRVVTRMSWDNKSYNGGDQGFFDAKAATGNANRLMMIHCYPSQWGMGYVDGNWSRGAITNGNVCDVEAKAYVGYQMLKVDGVELYTGNNSTALDFSPADFAVFACNFKNPDASSQSHGGTGLASASTCYYLKIYSNGDQTTNPDGDLVRDFVPAHSGDTFGLWDKLEGKFYPAVGAFTCGEVVSKLQPDAYVTCCAADAMTGFVRGLQIIAR